MNQIYKILPNSLLIQFFLANSMSIGIPYTIPFLVQNSFSGENLCKWKEWKLYTSFFTLLADLYIGRQPKDKCLKSFGC